MITPITFRELPLWMRIWIVLAFVLLVAGLLTCVILGVTSGGTDIDY